MAKPRTAAPAAAAASPTSGSATKYFDQEPGDVGAKPEEGRMTEGNDTRIAKDEVEREREQAEDCDLVEDEMAWPEPGRGKQRRRPRIRSRPDASAGSC